MRRSEEELTVRTRELIEEVEIDDQTERAGES
jgi:hypothetical protein